MNGFVVLGVRPGRIDRLAAIKVAAQERRLKNCPTVEGHAIRLAKALERIRQAPPALN